jgi:hypothetical protein
MLLTTSKIEKNFPSNSPYWGEVTPPYVLRESRKTKAWDT